MITLCLDAFNPRFVIKLHHNAGCKAVLKDYQIEAPDAFTGGRIDLCRHFFVQ
jgi:hypothetical protein